VVSATLYFQPWKVDDEIRWLKSPTSWIANGSWKWSKQLTAAFRWQKYAQVPILVLIFSDEHTFCSQKRASRNEHFKFQPWFGCKPTQAMHIQMGLPSHVLYLVSGHLPMTLELVSSVDPIWMRSSCHPGVDRMTKCHEMSETPHYHVAIFVHSIFLSLQGDCMHIYICILHMYITYVYIYYICIYLLHMYIHLHLHV
jgi:hypothetical protein